MDDSQAIRQIATAASEDDVLAIARAFYRTQGFAALSYARPSRDNPGRSEVTSFGFPEGFVADYRDGLAEFDPLPGLAARAGRPVRILDIVEGRLTGNQQLFIDAAREHGLTDGFLLPTFGPRQHIAVFSITMIDHEDRIAHADVPILHSVAQATHLRIDQLASEEVERPHLAPREITILHWIARGKSNEEIAMILGNKRPTIATHIKRIFAKLDVTDRASAAVKGLKFGLINV
ncbi:LuxR family transcriptional regulator [Qipengyuania flava]|jgi:DNA-binding CsgD family transcriptional regulator|uniref:LuxR family transcriptional regulator n=1 Tax=Qipengyuania flava TaxID=192812 RepID=UPI00321BA8EE